MNVKPVNSLAGGSSQEGVPEPYPPLRLEPWAEEGIYLLYETHGTKDTDDDTPALLFQVRGNTPELQLENLARFLAGFRDIDGDVSLFEWSHRLEDTSEPSALPEPPSANTRILQTPVGEAPIVDTEATVQTPELRNRYVLREPMMDPAIKQRLADIRNDYSRDLDFLTFVGGQYLLAFPGVVAGIWAAGLGAGAIATGGVVAGADVVTESALRFLGGAPPMTTGDIVWNTAINMGPGVVSTGVTALGTVNRGGVGSPIGRHAIGNALPSSSGLKGSPRPGIGEALVGSSRSQMRRAAEKAISADPNHPLKFLLDDGGRFKTQSGMTHAELMDRPDIVQMGHIQSNKAGGPERLMLQGAWENQFNNVTIEMPHIGGVVLDQPAVSIGGIAVDLKTATFWERIGWLKPGAVKSAPRIAP